MSLPVLLIVLGILIALFVHSGLGAVSVILGLVILVLDRIGPPHV